MTDNTFNTANPINPTTIITDSVDQFADSIDFYTFTLNQESTVDVILENLFADADLFLYDSNQNVIASSENAETNNESIVEDLTAGNYFLEVFAFSGFTEYTLDILTTPLNQNNGGNDENFATATPISTTEIITDSVDNLIDLSDFYRFNLSQDSIIDVVLTDLSADADLFLYDSNQNVIASSENANNNGESIVEDLTAGNYFLEVYAFSGFTDYILDILTDPIDNDNSQDDDRLGATQINLGQTISNQVQDFNDVNDYYVFQLGNNSNITIDLQGIGGDADIELYDQNGNYIDGSFSFTSEETISTSLVAGEYYINVLAYSGDIEYDLSVTADNVATPPDNNDAGNNLNQAFPIEINNSYAGTVGQEDTADYFRFQLNDSREVNVQLGGMSADADLQLLDSQGNIITFSENGGSQDETISVVLNSGTYHLRVNPFGDIFTNYTLQLSANQPPSSPNSFDSQTGYGFLDANLAVAEAVGQEFFPDAPDFGSSDDWALNMINAPDVWQQGYTGQGVVVAVLDTGVDRNHPDLFSNIWTNDDEIPGDGVDNDNNGFVDDFWGWNFAENKNNTLDRQGHGTHVAGTIAALNDNVGNTGVAYDAQIMPVKVLGDDGSGSFQRVANGIVYAVDNGADVINMSLGGPSFVPVIEQAIAYASSRGVIVVSAAGNESASQPSTPAIYADEYGVAVGAVDRGNNFSSFSNRAGGDDDLLYVTAPGEAILSTIPNQRYDSFDGTSMATPHVAGVVALMLEANPNLTDSQVRQIIANSTTDTPGVITSNLTDFGIQTAKSSTEEPDTDVNDDDSMDVNIPEVDNPPSNQAPQFTRG